jgi:hypothetical protein
LVVQTNRAIEVESTTGIIYKGLVVGGGLTFIYDGKRELVEQQTMLVRLKSTVTIQLTRTPDHK